MASGYVKAECGIVSCTPTRTTRIIDAGLFILGYALMAHKLTLIWSALNATL
jgi:hypothetical protein